MEKNQIFIKSGTEYKKITKELLAESNLAELIGDRDKMVGIKPNMVSASDPSNGATTHTEIIAGILEYLKENGFRKMMILEGSWVGDRTSDVFEVCGYQQICDGYDVEFHDTQKDKSFTKDCRGLELKICSSVKEVDFLINVPVMKGHCQTKITCALKNMKGLIPNTEKRHFHSMGLHIRNIGNSVMKLLTDICIHKYRIQCFPDTVHDYRISIRWVFTSRSHI